MSRQHGHVGDPITEKSFFCTPYGIECGSNVVGNKTFDCGPCPAGKTCIDGKCAVATPSFEKVGSLPYYQAGGQIPIDEKALYCTPNERECGALLVGGMTVDCGTCPAGKTCVDNKCLSAFQSAVASQFSAFPAEVPTPKPAPANFPIKDAFPGQPYLKALLQAIYNQLAPINAIPDEGKTFDLIIAWMTDKGFTNIVAACKWAGYEKECLGVETYCSQVGKIGLPYTVTQAACDQKRDDLLNKIGEKCSSTYTHDYLAAVEAAKKNLDEQQKEQQGGEVPPATEEKSNALLWVLGIGAVAAVGAAVYFTQKKPAATNPAPKQSGYKQFNAVVREAYAHAKKTLMTQAVVVRSDGFRIVPPSWAEWDDDEIWYVEPEGHYVHIKKKGGKWSRVGGQKAIP